MAHNYSNPGTKIVRPAGREGGWNPRGVDDEIVCPYRCVIIPGVDAVQVLDELRAAHPSITPVIAGTVHQAGLLFEGITFRQAARAVGVQGLLGRIVDNLTNRQTVMRDGTDVDPLSYVAAPSGAISKTMDTADAFNVDDWQADMRAEHEAAIAEFGGPEERGEDWPPRGEWPDEISQDDGPWLTMDLLTGNHRDTVIVLGIETERPSDIAAHLQFGDWNACPPPHVHVALARRWGERFGAIPICNSSDTVEFTVARPIEDRETALMVAQEHYLYCSEGADTIDELAASLIGAKVWSFWWD